MVAEERSGWDRYLSSARRWIMRQPPLGPQLLRLLARAEPRAVFVQIGSNDGDKYDPLKDRIASSRWRGVMVEPVPDIFDRLAARYDGHPRIALECAAVGTRSGPQTFYRLRRASEEELECLPRFYDALGSFRRDVLASHVEEIPDIEARIEEIAVPTLTFDELCERHHVQNLDLLHVDTEGYDLEILRTVDLQRRRPRMLVFEVHHLTEGERSEAAMLLREAGYVWFEEGLDWWCADARSADLTGRLIVSAFRYILGREGPGRVLRRDSSGASSLGTALVRSRAAARVMRHGAAPPATARSVTSTADDADLVILREVAPLTMTQPEPQLALLDAVEHVVRCDVPGAFVECGVWRGGSVLAMALKLRQLEAAPRHLYLYDTFDGMTEPTDADTTMFGRSAPEEWERAQAEGHVAFPEWFDPDDDARSPEAIVRRLIEAGHPESHVHVVRGPVEETIPAIVPQQIALLRLDTDWYESTRHELQHLYPLLASRGALLIDDYGHWEGCRRAVEEYFDGDRDRPLLHRAGYTLRIGVRP